MRISDWSSDVCSSDLLQTGAGGSGDSTVAGVSLVVDLGDDDAPANPNGLPPGEVIVPLDLDTDPNSPLVVTAPQQLVNAILTGIGRATCRDSVCQYC